MRAVLATVAMGLFILPANAKYSGGTGEPNDPYQIATAADLIALGETPEDYDKHFILTADIDLDPNLPGRKVFDKAVIAPDHGNSSLSNFDGHAFTGRLDGRGHTIAGLVIDSDCEYAGLFGLIGESATVCHVRLVGGSVRGAVQHFYYPRCGTGSLAGENRGLIEDCHSDVAVTGLNVVGGLVGENRGTILTSMSAGPVAGTDRCVGGLVGHNNHGTISTSRSAGPVAGKTDIGGLVGRNGGWVGYNRATISLSASGGSVTGMYTVGGLVGYNEDTISTSCSTGSVSGTFDVGGLTGYNQGAISISISTGSVTGTDSNVGGLVGYNNYGATISLSASAGLVTGTDRYIGGLVGSNFSGTISSCLWDMTASGQATSAGGTGLTTGQMQDVQTFLDMGWDFLGERENGTCEFWQMPEGGYPVLSMFNGYTPPLLQGEGTLDKPYSIETADDLGTIWYRPTACYQLAGDIDLSGITWDAPVIPIFCGRFDGKGHRIQGMTISGISYLGLFGLLTEDSTVWDLALEDTGVTGADKYIGGMVGYNHSGTISNSRCAGSVSGALYVGGMVGQNHGTILTASSTSSVNGNTCIGGLVGYSRYGTISNSYCMGSTHGNGPVGGLVGWNDSDVTGCYSTGRVDGNDAIGGLLGRNSGRTTDCYSRADVSGSGENIGGLAGLNDDYYRHGDFGRISNCYSTGSVSGTSAVGGLLGRHASGSVTSSFWDTQTSGQTTSAAGVGKTTAEMQMASTFLDAGWDFVGETVNGTADVWWIDEGKDYPHLWWEPRESERLAMVELDAAGFDAGIARGVVLVDFYATWCGACARQAPVLEEVADRLQGRAQVAKLDIDKAGSIIQRYSITAVPTLIVFLGGVEVERFVGVTGADVLVAAILSAVDSPAPPGP
jgi:thioredoxin